MKIYVASSWRNTLQPGVVGALRDDGHEVYDFRNPAPGDSGFQWSDVDPEWEKWDAEGFVAALSHPIPEAAFSKDMAALDDADVVVLVLPCGASAHLELGYAVGQGKTTAILLTESGRSELMYKMVDEICVDLQDLRDWLLDNPPVLWTCRVCGCTNDDCSQCIEKTGEPCHWVEPDLCSACVDQVGGDP
ncbi:hypothetical protein LCGC14_1069010 [marine sediment metagenome]|uniref:Nucleoside 2-deoxyribosyltransferase n=1 Tax=marine sediment metagenome TaxID=412755 RepID=A0A0F9Q206_9ZZZZ